MILQHQLKRVRIRENEETTMVGNEELKLGIDPDRVIGFFATKYNMAAGYSIFEPEDFEKKEFGADCFRIYNHNHNIAGIVTFSLDKGTVKFLDNEAYLEYDIKFLSAMVYNRVVIDNNIESFRAFGIV